MALDKVNTFGTGDSSSFHSLYFIGNEPRINSQWMISIEGHVVCEGIQPTFVSGLSAQFAVFYIFDLWYPDAASQTLKFIQR